MRLFPKVRQTVRFNRKKTEPKKNTHSSRVPKKTRPIRVSTTTGNESLAAGESGQKMSLPGPLIELTLTPGAASCLRVLFERNQDGVDTGPTRVAPIGLVKNCLDHNEGKPMPFIDRPPKRPTSKSMQTQNSDAVSLVRSITIRYDGRLSAVSIRNITSSTTVERAAAAPNKQKNKQKRQPFWCIDYGKRT